MKFALAICLFCALCFNLKAQVVDSISPQQAYYDSSSAALIGLYKQSEYEAALLIATDLRTFSQRSFGPNSKQYMEALNTAGLLNKKLGQFEVALPLYKEALQIAIGIHGEVHADIAQIYNNLAYLYIDMGRYSDAELMYIKCLDVLKETLGTEHKYYGLALTNLSYLYVKMRKYEEALPLAVEAVENGKKTLGEDSPGYGGRLNHLGLIYRGLGREDEALPLFLETLEIFKTNKLQHTQNYGVTLSNLALIYKILGQYNMAVESSKEALQRKGERVGSNSSSYATTLSNLAVLYQCADAFEESLPLLTEMNDVYRELIRQVFLVSNEADKLKLLQAKVDKFHIIESYAFTTGYKYDTLNTLMYDNALMLSGLVLNSTQQVFRTIEQSGDSVLIAQLQSWRQLKDELSAQYSKPLKQRATNLDSLEGVAAALEEQLVLGSSDFADQQEQFNVNWQQVQQKLQPSEVAIEFTSFQYLPCDDTDSTLYVAYVLQPTGKPQMVPLFEERQLLHAVGKATGEPAYIQQLYASRGAGGVGVFNQSSTSADLYKLIWKPLEPYLQAAERLYVAPAGKLHQIALHALPDENGTLLLDKFDMHYLTSTRMLVTGKPINTSDRSFQAYGGINYNIHQLGGATESISYANRGMGNTSWQALAGTLTEVTDIATLLQKKGWNTHSYTASQALEENIKSNTGPNAPDVLHIATHGFFFPDPELEQLDEEATEAPDDPMLRSGLILAGGNQQWVLQQTPEGKEDGILTAYEVAQLDLKNTDLVVLSACETGLGDVQGSEGVYGLQRAFKQAGANYLLISLWKVPDAQTVELMKLFYTQWQKGKSLPEAFRQAQLKMSKKYSPYEWAAFKLIR